MSTRSLKYTVRVNTRDDADIVEHLRGKNVSKTFKNALRAQKDNKLDAKIREQVIMCLHDLFIDAAAFEPKSPFSCDGESRQPPENRLAGNISNNVALGRHSKKKPKVARQPNALPEQEQPPLFSDDYAPMDSV